MLRPSVVARNKDVRVDIAKYVKSCDESHD
jgi:hypothetical protein